MHSDLLFTIPNTYPQGSGGPKTMPKTSKKSYSEKTPKQITKKSTFYAKVIQMTPQRDHKWTRGGGPTNQLFPHLVGCGTQDGLQTAPRATKTPKSMIFNGGSCFYVPEQAKRCARVLGGAYFPALCRFVPSKVSH